MKKRASQKQRTMERFNRRKNSRVDVRSAWLSRNFSDVEDSDDGFQVIASLAAKAGQNAAREARAAGLPRAYSQNQGLVEIAANGSITVLVPRLQQPALYIKYKPGTILHVTHK